MGIVSARSFHAKSVRPSLPSVNDGVRLGTTFRPLSNAAYQRIPRSMTSSVSSKLSRSDFVQDIRMLSGVRRQEGSAVRQGGSLRIADSMA
jgi:hypothetical protein